MVKIPKRVIDRFIKEVGRFQKILKSAKDRDVNESDTVTIIVDMLSTIFGYDKYAEITSEQAIRGTYCDLAIKLNDSIKYLIEVKAIGLHLKENHLRQTINYGINHGISWVVLTNGINWEIYKIKFEKLVGFDLVCKFNFLDLNSRKKDDQNMLFLLCKGGIAKAAIEDFHEHLQNVNRFIISAILLSEPIISLIRRELKKVSPTVKPSNEEVKKILKGEVLKREIIEGEAASKAQAKIKRAYGRSSQKRQSLKTPQPHQQLIDNSRNKKE